MSNVSHISNKHDIQEQACLWVSKLDRGLSTTELSQLTVWCNENKAHHTALLDMAAHWDDFSVLNELSALFPLEVTPKKSGMSFAAFAMVASFALVSLLGTNLLVSNSWRPWDISTGVQAKSFITRIGQQTSVTLSDGSIVQLNTNSMIYVAYTPQHRQITLVRGEASFDVAKDKNRPFTVTAGEQSFTALGTVFNVQKNDNQAMELVVTEGRVLITQASASLQQLNNSLSELSDEQLPGILVTSGEKAVIEKNINRPVSKVPLEQIQRDLAWQQGMLIFEGEPLSQALIEVERYTAINFEIVDPQIANLKVAGYFKAGDIDGLLASLNSNFGITANNSDDNVIMLTAAR